MNVGACVGACRPVPLLGPLARFADTPAEPRDTVAPAPRFSRAEMAARLSGDLLVHLALSDGPNIVGMLANVVHLPPALAPLVGLSNVANTLTGLPALVADVRELRGTLKNPLATATDRRIDWAHLLAGDLLSTVGSLTPFVFPMSHPLALGFFLGSQLVGIGADLAKTAYDWHRQGQQSAWREAQEAMAGRSPQ